jgi:hypothetical protein
MMLCAILVLAAFLQEDSYLPLKEGTQWTYIVEDVGAAASEPAREVVAKVGGPAPASETEWTAVSNYLGYRSCWLRTTGGSIDLKLEDRADAPVLTLLKGSAKTGDTWTGTLGKDTLTFTLRGQDSVEHGHAKLQALHVEFTAVCAKHPNHAARRGELWFASGIGVVRAQLAADLDCHTSLTKVYQLKP